MKIFLKIIIILGYLLFGTMWIESLYHVVLKNSMIDIFELVETPSTHVTYQPHYKKDNLIIVYYEYEVNKVVYTGEVIASKEAFANKVGMKQEQQVLFNSLIPNVSFLKGWKLNASYNFNFFFSTFFLLLIIFFHMKVDREKWLRKYR